MVADKTQTSAIAVARVVRVKSQSAAADFSDARERRDEDL